MHLYTNTTTNHSNVVCVTVWRRYMPVLTAVCTVCMCVGVGEWGWVGVGGCMPVYVGAYVCVCV